MVNRIAFLAFIFAFPWLQVISLKGQEKTACDLMIVGGNYFDSQTKTFQSNQGLAMLEGKLLALDCKPQKFKCEQTLRLADDQFILPGLVDCHAHYNVRLIRKRREEFEVTMLPIEVSYSATDRQPC